MYTFTNTDKYTFMGVFKFTVRGSLTVLYEYTRYDKIPRTCRTTSTLRFLCLITCICVFTCVVHVVKERN